MREGDDLSMYEPHQSPNGARDPQVERTGKAPGGTIIGQHETAASLGNSETRSLPGLEIPFEVGRSKVFGFTELDERQPRPVATRDPAQPFTRR